MVDITIPEAECLRPYFSEWADRRAGNDNAPGGQTDAFPEDECMEGGLLTFY
jgi:hypothetical protein